jgi:hypothetical protein
VSDPNETANLANKILEAYREHVAADGGSATDADATEEDLEEDRDCE